MTNQPLKLCDIMRLGSAFLICLIALTRCVMLHSANVYFDLDPTITNELPRGVLGPGSSVLLDVMVLALCSIALLGETMQGRTIHWKYVCLAAFPLIVIWYQGRTDPMQFFHGASWLAALMACVTFAHLCRGKRISILAPAFLLAITIPLLASAAFSYGEHQQLVRYFEEHTQEVLGMNGLQTGTPAAAVYEERLRSFGPMGWFSTPNIFGGIVISLGVMWTFIGATVYRNKNKTYFAVTTLLGLLCFLAALATFSKTVLVLVLMVVILASCIYKKKTNVQLKKWGGWVAISVVLASVYVVFFRGCLAESALGERSLLVRSQYFVGGLEIAGRNILGVGPAQIQDAWLGVREETATEVISSTHNIVFDWLVSYGIFAICWIAILVKLLWRAGEKLSLNDRSNKRQVFTSGVALSAIILVVDSQVDLTMFDLGSTLFAFCLLGIAGSLSNDETKSQCSHSYVSTIPFVMACVVLYFGYLPLAHDEFLQKNAASSIIAGESIEEVAGTLDEHSVTRQSSIIAANLFLSVGNKQSALSSLEDVIPSSGVWFLRTTAASRPEDAVFAARNLVDIDPNGLQSALLLADALWETEDKQKTAIAYNRVLSINNAYQQDLTRALPKSRIELINHRLEKLR